MGGAEQQRIIKTTCGMCFSCCGMLVHVENNRVVKLAGDPASPVNRGTLCAKGRAALDLLYHPDRLVRPLIRKGARGEGKWQPLPWDEALDMAAGKLGAARQKQGAHSCAFILGTTKGLIDIYMERFVNAFGSPNIATSGHVCFLPRFFAAKATHGFFPVPDYEGNPQCIILWGANLSATRMGEHKKIMALKRAGSRLVVIDPVKTSAAQRADLHLPLVPGTDLVLAMGLIRTIIENRWHDQVFVEKWCTGFERLKQAAARYPAETVASVTGMDQERVEAVARAYATAPRAVIQWGNAVDHGVHSFQTARAISILRAITGKLDRYGCDIQPLYPVPGTGSLKTTLGDRISPEIWDLRISREQQRLSWFRRVLPSEIVHTLNTGDPYPLRCVYVCGSNPVLTFSNSKNAFDALTRAEFLVVSDRFITPTAQQADLILPPAVFLEYDSIIAPPYYAEAAIQQQAVRTPGALSDYEIVNGLARRLGMAGEFVPDIPRFFDQVLAPSGLNFEQFRLRGTLSGMRREKKYSKKGFDTPSGKVELYCEQLFGQGFDPLPVFKGIAPPSDRYPLVLTSAKSAYYRHADNRQLPTLRAAHPEPRMMVHPRTAEDYGIQDNRPVTITTKNGSIRQRAAVTDRVEPGIVCADFGWWFPDQGAAGDSWTRANLNLLTSDRPPSALKSVLRFSGASPAGWIRFRIPMRMKISIEIRYNP